MRIIKPPDPINVTEPYCVFLAGSIEMGAAVDWQYEVGARLTGMRGAILNPRRDDWDSSWKQSLNSPNFVEQVEWELMGLEKCNTIMMNFDPDTKSVITLLELGLYARYTGKLRVHCPEGYWRKGNVDIVCREYGVMQFPTFDALIWRIAQEARSMALVNS